MGFPGTWMTESESVVYRVVPKCACSTIGQIMFYADHGAFYDGDIHDSTTGLHKWSQEASQPIIKRDVKAGTTYAFTCVRNLTPASFPAFSTRSAAFSATANAIAATWCRC